MLEAIEIVPWVGDFFLAVSSSKAWLFKFYEISLVLSPAVQMVDSGNKICGLVCEAELGVFQVKVQHSGNVLAGCGCL